MSGREAVHYKSECNALAKRSGCPLFGSKVSEIGLIARRALLPSKFNTGELLENGFDAVVAYL